MIWLLGIGLLAYSLILAILYFRQDRLIFKPKPGMTRTPGDTGLDFCQETILTSDQKQLCAWYLPNPNHAFCLLFLHGNSDSLSDIVDSLKQLHALGFNILAIDYRGYGLSSGRPSEQGVYLDAEAAWQHLLHHHGFDPSHIIIHGRSLGAAIAAELASHHHPAGLIMESTFTSMTDLVKLHYPYIPVRTLLRYRFNTLERMRQIKTPTLFVHSQEDEFIPYQHGQSLFIAAHVPKEFLTISGVHYDGHHRSGVRYSQGLKGFFCRHIAAQNSLDSS